MDVSNASGYDGTTVAADACYASKQATGRAQGGRDRDAEPAGAPGGADVRARLRDGGGRGAAHRRHDRPRPVRRPRARAPPARSSRSRTSSAASSRLPIWPPRRADAGALAVAHVDLMTLGVLEAPGDYGCALAIGEGQSAGNPLSYGGPHYGFLAARSDYIRKLPGRIVGETDDRDGRRGFVLTLQTREQHIRREKATSNITTNQTLLAVCRARVPVAGSGPDGAARRRPGVPLAVPSTPSARLGLPLAFDRPTFKEFAVRLGRPAQRGDPRRPQARRPSRLRARPRLPGHGRRAARVR